MTSKDLSGHPVDQDKATSPNLTGVRLFKSMVRVVRQKITENKLTKSTSIGDVPTVVGKLEELSMGSGETSPQKRNGGGSGGGHPKSPPGKEALRRLFGASRTYSEEKLRGCSGYSSDSGTDKQGRGSSGNNEYRVRIHQNVRTRSKSYSRTEKKPKKILRPPSTYDYVRGPSGLVSHRVRVPVH